MLHHDNFVHPLMTEYFASHAHAQKHMANEHSLSVQQHNGTLFPSTFATLKQSQHLKEL
jgi:quinol monooxygenase YgiN